MKRIGIAVLAVAIVAAGIAGWIVFGPGPLAFAGGGTVPLSAYKDSSPAGAPSSLAHASQIDRGEYLARAADCEACHTVKGGAPFAGGLALRLPFGTLYSPNITPDVQTGIGSWTDADFLAAVHKGIARDGTRLYPAFPYAAYTMMTDEDVLAIKAYLFSRPPVHNDVPAGALAFPFNQRWLMAIWSTFFNADKRFEPNPARSAEWNRGAYLAEAMAHCGECHTPRNLMQALDNRRKFAGAVAAGWKAYNITPDHGSGIGAWNDEAISHYLAAGHAAGFGTATGPMGEAVDKSLTYLVPEDIKAIVAYLRTVPAIADPALPAPKAAPAPKLPGDGVQDADARGAAIFAGACAGCHGWTGISPVLDLASFTGSRAINDPSARNIAQAVVWGATRQTAAGPVTMPSFGQAYSDVEIAAVARYVTQRFGNAPSSITAREVAQLRRQTSQ